MNTPFCLTALDNARLRCNIHPLSLSLPHCSLTIILLALLSVVLRRFSSLFFIILYEVFIVVVRSIPLCQSMYIISVTRSLAFAFLFVSHRPPRTLTISP